jgi:hypothetical protein
MAECPTPLVRTALLWKIEVAVERALKKVFKDDPDLSKFKADLGDHLCVYYNATVGLKRGSGVSPISCGVAEGKGFKARWILPGQGKSGGLRLAVLAMCKRKTVTAVFAEVRSKEPTDAQLEKAFKNAAPGVP